MADSEHLEIFKQGVAAWNRWRQKHRGLRPDLSAADLKRANFRYANLNDANLEHANLEGANLGRAFLEGAELYGATQRGAHFFSADLRHSDLREADLREAQLWYAHLDRADLRGVALAAADLRSSELARADLRGADLTDANLAGANLWRADLSDARLAGANLHGTRFSECKLAGADLGCAIAASTTFNAVDLGHVRGLETVRHDRPSSIGVDTLARTAASLGGDLTGYAPVTQFLRAAGVAERYLTLEDAAAGRGDAQIYIVYSLADRGFARRLYSEMQRRGWRCWLQQQPMLPGNDVDDSFDLGPRRADAVILVCSGAALSSWWLAAELDPAGEPKPALLPIRVGDADSRQAWPKTGAARRLPPPVAEFIGWHTDAAAFGRALKQLLTRLDKVT